MAALDERGRLMRVPSPLHMEQEEGTRGWPR